MSQPARPDSPLRPNRPHVLSLALTAAVLATGVLVLASGVTGGRLPPLPGPADRPAPAPAPAAADGLVIDRLDTWAETNGKERASPRGNNGVGNGVDPQPPGNPNVNDGPGTGPGNPGNKGGGN